MEFKSCHLLGQRLQLSSAASQSCAAGFVKPIYFAASVQVMVSTDNSESWLIFSFVVLSIPPTPKVCGSAANNPAWFKGSSVKVELNLSCFEAFFSLPYTLNLKIEVSLDSCLL